MYPSPVFLPRPLVSFFSVLWQPYHATYPAPHLPSSAPPESLTLFMLLITPGLLPALLFSFSNYPKYPYVLPAPPSPMQSSPPHRTGSRTHKANEPHDVTANNCVPFSGLRSRERMSTRVCLSMFGPHSILTMYWSLLYDSLFFFPPSNWRPNLLFLHPAISLLSYLDLVPLVSVVEAEYKPGSVCFAEPAPPDGYAPRGDKDRICSRT